MATYISQHLALRRLSPHLVSQFLFLALRPGLAMRYITSITGSLFHGVVVLHGISVALARALFADIRAWMKHVLKQPTL
jgi:hypothetical protein